jgi:ammonium transporter, Amt family
VVNTNLAACGGGIGWTLLEYFHTKKFSIIGFCSGIIAGLVGITPAAGYGKFCENSIDQWQQI